MISCVRGKNLPRPGAEPTPVEQHPPKGQVSGSSPVETGANSKSRRRAERYDKQKYKRRNRIEIIFGRLKDWRRVAT